MGERVSLFWVLVLAAAVQGFKTNDLGWVIDSNDNVVQRPGYPSEFLNTTSFSFPENTPWYIVEAVKAEFSTLDACMAYRIGVVSWEREFSPDLCPGELQQLVVRVADRLPVPPQDPCQLPPGAYTWILTGTDVTHTCLVIGEDPPTGTASGQDSANPNNFQLTFGRVNNRLEWGVKHLQIAGGRAAYLAGEIVVGEDGNILWNIGSGTFSKAIRKLMEAKGNKHYKHVQEKMMKAVWKSTTCRGHFKKVSTDTDLLALSISLSSLEKHCSSSEFNFTWTATGQSVCSAPGICFP
jgi:hypothetical protein